MRAVSSYYNNMTQDMNQHSSRDALLRKLKNAEKITDQAKQLSVFDSILSEPDIDCLLSKKELGNVHWNKALTHLQVSHWFFNEKNKPVQAHSQIELALEHMGKAASLYESFDDRVAAETELNSIQEKRSSLIKYMEDQINIPELQTATDEYKSLQTIYRSGKHRHKFYTI